MSDTSNPSFPRRRKMIEKGNNHDMPFQSYADNTVQNSSRSSTVCGLMPEDDSPTFPSSHTSVSAFMVDDKHYLEYMLHSTLPNRSKSLSTKIDNVKCAKGCATFSFVGIIFLIFIGLLIEKQPLYLKGIKPKSYYYSNNYNRARKSRSDGNSFSRKAKKNYSYKDVMGGDLNPNNARRRLEMQLGNIDLTISRKKKDQDRKEENHEFSPKRLLSDSSLNSASTTNDKGNMDNSNDYRAHELAKTSFKTAVAYLLTLVLSLLYIREENRFRNHPNHVLFFRANHLLKQCIGSIFSCRFRKHKN